MVGTTARTWFVATLTLALAASGGSPRMGQGPPVISAFTSSPSDAITGHRITLSWTVAGATDLSISDIGPVTGTSADVHPTSAAWDSAAAHIQVFKMYEQIRAFPDASLRAMFAELRRRHIALALEFGPLLVTTWDRARRLSCLTPRECNDYGSTAGAGGYAAEPFGPV